MRVTSKGQVTIPQDIREKLGITPRSEVDFVEENCKVYLVRKTPSEYTSRFHSFRGRATVELSTEEIMSLTRGE